MVDPWEIPAWLRLTREERAEGWREHPPQPMPRFDARPSAHAAEEPATRLLREQLEANARAKKEQGLAALAAWKEEHADELPARKCARRARRSISKRRRPISSSKRKKRAK